MVKRVVSALVIAVLCVTFCSCSKEGSDFDATPGVDSAVYTDMSFPSYSTDNPVRYLDEGDWGKYNGWQNFGKSGEIKTIAQPIGSTYAYQMYSYYIRNDLSHLYADDELPESISDLPEWIADVTKDGRRAFWYSMGNKLPDTIMIAGVEAIISNDGLKDFVRAEYEVCIGEAKEEWIVYFIEDEGAYSAYAVKVNESYETVMSFADAIVKSYQLKQ